VTVQVKSSDAEIYQNAVPQKYPIMSENHSSVPALP